MREGMPLPTNLLGYSPKVGSRAEIETYASLHDLAGRGVQATEEEGAPADIEMIDELDLGRFVVRIMLCRISLSQRLQIAKCMRLLSIISLLLI